MSPLAINDYSKGTGQWITRHCNHCHATGSANAITCSCSPHPPRHFPHHETLKPLLALHECTQEKPDHFEGCFVLPVSVYSMLHRAGMTPNVTLHWFAHPQWFEDLGEFQKEENILLFVDWAETAFALFGKHNRRYWPEHHANHSSDICCCSHCDLVLLHNTAQTTFCSRCLAQSIKKLLGLQMQAAALANFSPITIVCTTVLN